MPRPEPKKDSENKVSDFYVSREEDPAFGNYQEIRDAVDVTGKTVERITHIFSDKNSKKTHISQELIHRLEQIWSNEVAPILMR